MIVAAEMWKTLGLWTRKTSKKQTNKNNQKENIEHITSNSRKSMKDGNAENHVHCSDPIKKISEGNV